MLAKKREKGQVPKLPAHAVAERMKIRALLDMALQNGNQEDVERWVTSWEAVSYCHGNSSSWVALQRQQLVEVCQSVMAFDKVVALLKVTSSVLQPDMLK